MNQVQSSSPQLKRALNTPLLTLYGLGVTVGAGIYVLVGTTAAEAGPYASASFLIAAVVVAFTAFSYAELSTRFPVSAGEAAYVQAGFKMQWLATGVGLAVALSGIVSASAVAIGAASYLESLTSAPHGLLTISVVLIMGLIALWGITQSVLVAAIITVIEVSGLLFVIVWGFAIAEPMGVPLSAMLPPLGGSHWVGIASASLLAFFAFVGFEDMANVAEEVKEPVRTMPKAIILTLVLATVLYIGTTSAVLLSVPLEALATSSAPLTLVFGAAPESITGAFSLVAIVATINGVLIQMIMASRVLYGLADRGQLPRGLAGVWSRTQTPVPATVTVILMIAVLSQVLPIDELAEHTSQIVLVVFVLVNVALIRLKLRERKTTEAFHVPLIVPILGSVTSVLLIGASFL